MEYGKSADVGHSYGLPYLKGSNRDDVVVGGDQPVHVTVSVHLGDRLVHQLDVFSGLLHNRLRLCKLAAFGSCCAERRGGQGGDIRTDVKGVRVLRESQINEGQEGQE